jgi:glycosyltransferase involved in cell wall biosynthesis
VKIALVGNAFPPDFVGGTELVLEAQALALRARGHQVRVIVGSAAPGSSALQRSHTAEGIEVLRIPRKAGEELPGRWKLPRVARLVEQAALGSELVHVHHGARLSGDLVRRLVQRAPTFLSLHDHFTSCPRSFRCAPEGRACPADVPTGECVECLAPLVPEVPAQRLQALLLERWHDQRAEVSAATGVIVPSRHLRSTLARELHLAETDWALVPHGLCRPLTAPARRSAGGSVRGAPLVVLSFGNRTDVKGTADLVSACARLAPGSVRLVLAGAELRPGYDAELRALAGGLELELHGPYDAAGLERLAAQADLAAFPSRAAESYGLVVEEALALGLPTWVSDRGALAEVLERAGGPGAAPGGVLPAQRPEAWAAELRALVEFPSRLQDSRARIPGSIRSAADAVDELLELYSGALRRCAVRSR